jgi:hypothetical protein
VTGTGADGRNRAAPPVLLPIEPARRPTGAAADLLTSDISGDVP